MASAGTDLRFDAADRFLDVTVSVSQAHRLVHRRATAPLASARR